MSNHENGLSVASRTTPLEPLLDVRAAAGFLGVSRRQVYLLLERHELPAVRVGQRIRFVPDDLRAYLERHRDARSMRHDDRHKGRPQSTTPAPIVDKARDGA